LGLPCVTCQGECHKKGTTKKDVGPENRYPQ
jgi:hypothetical protein